jgi:peptidoglycan/LPS O-acetylase OafA/YrhL
MGYLRLIFALSVLIYHVNAPLFGFDFFNSSLAVTGFFVISGFYMALILQEKYIQKHSYQLFITNRLLRIYPTYWLILFATIIVNIVLVSYTNTQFIYTNIMDFIRDVTLLVRTDYFEINPNKFQTLTIGPAWTLVLELLFYFIAPFIVKSTKKIVFFMILSVAIRYTIYHFAALHNIQPSVRFFPVELVFFLLGALSYKIYAVIKTYKWNKTLLFSLTSLFLIFTLLYNYLPFDVTIGRWANMKENIYLLVLFLIIPFGFLFTKKSKIDKFFGDLSYPFYLSHVLVIYATAQFFQNMNRDIYLLFAIGSTLLLSVLIVKFFEHPIDVWRQQRLKKL